MTFLNELRSEMPAKGLGQGRNLLLIVDFEAFYLCQ